MLSLPRYPIGANTTTVYVTRFGASQPGGTGPIRIDFTVPTGALKPAGTAEWYQLYGSKQSCLQYTDKCTTSHHDSRDVITCA
jgi:hypothetical protein